MTDHIRIAAASHPALPDIAIAIRREHAAARSHAHTALDHARQCGEHLAAAKAQLSHGEWLPWLTEHCEISERAARNYMRVAAHWQKIISARHADITSIGGALRLISAPRERKPAAPYVPPTADAILAVTRDASDDDARAALARLGSPAQLLSVILADLTATSRQIATAAQVGTVPVSALPPAAREPPKRRGEPLDIGDVADSDADILRRDIRDATAILSRLHDGMTRHDAAGTASITSRIRLLVEQLTTYVGAD